MRRISRHTMSFFSSINVDAIHSFVHGRFLVTDSYNSIDDYWAVADVEDVPYGND